MDGIALTIGRRVLVLAGSAALVLSSPLARASSRPTDYDRVVNPHTIESWQADAGLPHNSVISLLPSRDGHLWVGTQEGLVRFDGFQFERIEGGALAGRAATINALAEGEDGVLWVGTATRGLIALREGESRAYGSADGLSQECILDLLASPDGTLWIGTCGGGLNRMKDGRISVMRKGDGLPGDFVRTLLEDSIGRLWIGTFDGLAEWDGETFRTYDESDGLLDREVFALAEAPAGVVWVGTRRGLNRIRGGVVTVVGAVRSEVNDLAAGPDGALWVGTRGLVRIFNDEARRFGTADGLTKEDVVSIATGNDGSLWVGTIGGGLNRLRAGFISTLGPREGLSHSLVSVLQEDEEGLWVGTWGGGLNLVQDDRVISVSPPDDPAWQRITTIFRDSRGALWVGRSGEGLTRRTPGGDSRTYTMEEGLSSNRTTAVAEDSDGSLLVGTVDGLDRLSGDHFEAVSIPYQPEHDMVHVLFPDSRGALWIGRDQGLIRKRGDRLERYTAEDGLADNKVYSLHEDASGSLWIGTAGGLSLYRDGVFSSITTSQGLCDGKVFWILEDDDERLWMSSNRGIFRVAKRDVEEVVAGRKERVPCRLFGRTAGMRAAECNGGLAPSGWRTRDGLLWFPTTEGVVALDPRADFEEPPAPRAKLEQVLVNRRLVEAEEESSWPRGSGEVEFQFSAVALLDPHRVRFRYRLSGFDEGWRETGDQRSARYTNLPAGDYSFRVSAAYEDGTWDSAGATLAFRLEPRFYQTRGFLAVTLGGLILAGASLAFLLIQRRRVRERKLTALIEERTHRLRETTERLDALNQRRSEFLAGISHELKTPLTLIMLYAETLLEKVDRPAAKREGYYRIIERETRRLTQLVERILDFSRIEEGVKTYRLERGDLTGMVTQSVQSYREYLSAQGREVELAADAELPPVRFDSEALANAVINLVDNAAKYSQAPTGIRVRVRGRGSSVTIEVSDEGAGIPPEEQERIFERFYRAAGQTRAGGYGIGLFLVRDIMQAHGGRVEVDSEPGCGSTFRLVLPVATDESAPEERR